MLNGPVLLNHSTMPKMVKCFGLATNYLCGSIIPQVAKQALEKELHYLKQCSHDKFFIGLHLMYPDLDFRFRRPARPSMWSAWRCTNPGETKPSGRKISSWSRKPTRPELPREPEVAAAEKEVRRNVSGEFSTPRRTFTLSRCPGRVPEGSCWKRSRAAGTRRRRRRRRLSTRTSSRTRFTPTSARRWASPSADCRPSPSRRRCRRACGVTRETSSPMSESFPEASTAGRPCRRRRRPAAASRRRSASRATSPKSPSRPDPAPTPRSRRSRSTSTSTRTSRWSDRTWRHRRANRRCRRPCPEAEVPEKSQKLIWKNWRFGEKQKN